MEEVLALYKFFKGYRRVYYNSGSRVHRIVLKLH